MKKIILSESQKDTLVSIISGRQYAYDPEKVLIVKKYLDSNFKRANYESIGNDGSILNTPIVGRINIKTGNILQNMYDYQLLDLLIDQFKNMFSDKDERRLFLGQVMRDWYDNKIGLYGSLSVNHL